MVMKENLQVFLYISSWHWNFWHLNSNFVTLFHHPCNLSFFIFTEFEPLFSKQEYVLISVFSANLGSVNFTTLLSGYLWIHFWAMLVIRTLTRKSLLLCFLEFENEIKYMSNELINQNFEILNKKKISLAKT